MQSDITITVDEQQKLAVVEFADGTTTDPLPYSVHAHRIDCPEEEAEDYYLDTDLNLYRLESCLYNLQKETIAAPEAGDDDGDADEENEAK